MPKLALCLVLADVGGGAPDAGLPGWLGGQVGQPHPGHGLPGSGARPGQLPSGGGRPPQGSQLPAYPIHKPGKPTPPGTSPGAGLWVVAYVPGKGFQWVSVSPGVPEKPQPPPEGGGAPPDPTKPDNTLPSVPVDPENPTAPPVVDNTLPPEGTPPPTTPPA